MPATPSNRILRRTISAVLIPSYLAACTAWSPAKAPLPETLAKQPSSIRLTVAGRRKIEITRPQLVGDSVIGIEVLSSMQLRDPEVIDKKPRVAVAIADVMAVEEAHTDAAMTGLGVIALGGIIGLMVAVVALSGQDVGWGLSKGGSSCPLLYAWDGNQWWRASGTFAGAIAEGLARTDVTVLGHAVATNGELRLRLANELAETDYTDQVAVLAIDHPAGTIVVPDGEGRLHVVGAVAPPVVARDFRGRDALRQVGTADDWSWESIPTGRDSSRLADLRDGLVLAFPRPRGAATAGLVVTARNSAWATMMLHEFVGWHGRETATWYDSLDLGGPTARATEQLIEGTGGMDVAVLLGDRWVDQGWLALVGPEIAKVQLATLDLRGVTGDTVWVRLAAIPSAWLVDQVALGVAPAPPSRVATLDLASARDTTGRDRRADLAKRDRRYLVQQTGDRVNLTFAVPATAPGLLRSYAVAASGWYRLPAQADAPPDRALLARVLGDSTAAARIAVGRLTAIVAAMNRN